MSKKKKVLKISILILFILLIIFVVIKYFPVLKSIFTESGRLEFKKEIESLGVKGFLIVVGLVILQMFLIFVPIEPIELLAGMCYGPFGGLFAVYLGCLVSATLIYIAVKKYGRKFIYAFASKEKIDKIENSKFWKDSKKVSIALFIAYFIPGTPKGLLTYIGALLPMSLLKFLIIVLIARIPEVISSTIAGSSILDGKWVTIILAYFIAFIFSALIFFIYNKITENKEKSK